jgi:hypothetical protein
MVVIVRSIPTMRALAMSRPYPLPPIGGQRCRAITR